MRSAGAWDEVRAASGVAGEPIARGVRQRVLAIEAFLADVCGPGRVFDDGVLPWRLLFTSAAFRREAAGVVPANGVRVHVAGFDLISDDQGGLRVLRQNVRGPAVPVRLDTAPLLAALRAAAPPAVVPPAVVSHATASATAVSRAADPGAGTPGTPAPRIVVLTNGGRDPAYREHAALAGRLGVPLVEGRDLTCRRDRVYAGTDPVDVVYRYVADDWLDPLHFRPESRLGCPGLLNVARAGGVTIANAVGNGVADDPRVRARVPDLIRYYLRQDPLLGEAEAEAESAGGTVRRAFAVNDGERVRVLA